MNKEIYKVRRPENISLKKSITVTVPGSKSITNRALLTAAMADGTSCLKGCLTSDDARHFIECLKALGFPVEEVSDGALGSNITITGFGGKIPQKQAEIYVGSAGTAARFLVAMLAFSEGEYVVNSSEQMKKRPMQPLIDALRNAGAKVDCLENEGHFPLKIKGASKENIPDSFTVNIDKSSQFLSALLIAAGTLGKKAEIKVEGSHGLSYVDLTAEMMKSFGVTAEKLNDGQIRYVFSGNDSYHPLDYDIEPDMSAAAYFYALAAVLGITVTVRGVHGSMLQGDTDFIGVLAEMGCTAEITDEKITVTGPKQLKGGFNVDMSAFSDQALTLAAIAPFADAPVTISGIEHIRLQECDRINAIVKNLSSLGVKTDERQDSVTIYPSDVQGGDIETFDDHRVAMSFALTGLRADGVNILDPSCCKKTFAEYFDVLDKVLDEINDK
ncbi:MAG: 3-phosphoshikimate 1-carboxyvinyltransferase [Oscillospiraceae bacterium]|nr:3-phosphoshikimate 1-carboxyvinyltransferase [Oscillospiraceae bacterium]